jgi:hypothetical protein
LILCPDEEKHGKTFNPGYCPFFFNPFPFPADFCQTSARTSCPAETGTEAAAVETKRLATG